MAGIWSNRFVDPPKAAIRPESYPQLDIVVEFMKHKKSARLEISGHTDNVGRPKTNKELPAAAETDIEVLDDELLEPESAELNGDSHQPQKAPKAKSKPKPSTYLPDLLTTDQITAFKEFAKQKNPTSRSKQYLTAAYWLKEHSDNPSVNADKVYTLFKTAGWSTGFNDWRATFDNLVHSEHLRKVAKGEFAINPLGEDEARGTS